MSICVGGVAARSRAVPWPFVAAAISDPHRHRRPAARARPDLEAVGERRDQRQAEAEAAALDVGERADAAAGVADRDDDLVAVDPGDDPELADLVGLIGVGDDVRARLGDDGLQVRDHLGVHPVDLGEAGERVANQRNVLDLGRQHEFDAGVGLHGAQVTRAFRLLIRLPKRGGGFSRASSRVRTGAPPASANVGAIVPTPARARDRRPPARSSASRRAPSPRPRARRRT